jgi:hypothetical protein
LSTTGYKRPKIRLHREFLYLNFDSVINSLSAIEAGKVDEIIEKTNEATDRSVQAGVAAGPVRVGAGRNKQATTQAELVRTRTRFSAFDAWHNYLREHDAIGTFDTWDDAIRNELAVGDTIEFEADLTLAPLHKIFSAYRGFVDMVNKPGSAFRMTPKELGEAKTASQSISGWLNGPSGQPHVAMYMAPYGHRGPLVVARLGGEYLITGLANAEGRFTVIGQVDTLLSGDDQVAAIRLVRDAPPTPLEVETSMNAMRNMIEPARALGVDITEEDLTLRAPTVILNPLAIYK